MTSNSSLPSCEDNVFVADCGYNIKQNLHPDDAAKYIISTLNNNINKSLNACQALILVPNRHQINQIYTVITTLSAYTCHACVPDGTNVKDDIQVLKRGVQIVIGTAGRYHHIIQRDKQCLNKVKLFIINELFTYCSKKEISYMLKKLPRNVELVLLTAKMACKMKDIFETISSRIKIYQANTTITLEHVEHFHIAVDRIGGKFYAFCDFYDTLFNSPKIMIFCNTYRKADWLARVMKIRGYSAVTLYRDATIKDRHITVSKFYEKTCNFIITTDLTIRNINVPLFVNYDMPSNVFDYKIRVGHGTLRCKQRIVINMVAPDDETMLCDIENYYKIHIDKLPGIFESFD